MSHMDHRILGLPFRCEIKRRLICCGFNTVGDMKHYLEIEKLQNITNLAKEDLNNIISTVKRYTENDGSHNSCEVYSVNLSSRIVMQSVKHILKDRDRKVNHIVSFSSAVDKLLGGGFPMGRIIEIAGEAGLGKTQFAFQLCVNVQIPKDLGGVEAEAVFLDVEGTFAPQRVQQIASAAVRRYQCLAHQNSQKLAHFSVKEIMSRIYLFRCTNSVQLMASCHQMAQFLKNHDKVKLMVIDSIAHSLRVEDDYIARTKFLMTLKGIFLDLIRDFNICIIIVNQVTTKIGADCDSYNIPALGAKWSYVPNIKLMLYKRDGKRLLHQYKSPDQPDGIAEYCVTREGIRNVTI